MLTTFACMPTVNWLPCSLQPYSPLWPVIGYGGLIVAGLVVTIIAAIVIKKQGNKK